MYYARACILIPFALYMLSYQAAFKDSQKCRPIKTNLIASCHTHKEREKGRERERKKDREIERNRHTIHPLRDGS